MSGFGVSSSCKAALVSTNKPWEEASGNESDSSGPICLGEIMSDQALPPPLEPDPDRDPEPDWQVYEGAIAHIEESYENCKVTRNYRPTGRRSGVKRQVDVWLEATVGDNHIITVAIECRRYEKPVAIKDIDAFCGFLDDIGANKGVMISHSGYTTGAEKRAKGEGIELKILTLEEAEDFDWEEFVQDSCQTGGCFGTINWYYSDGSSEAGRCNNCGTFHIRCGNCGDKGWYHEADTEKCWCGMQWRLIKEKGETCGIKEIPLAAEAEEGNGEEPC
jgi:hypothetical protein